VLLGAGRGMDVGATGLRGANRCGATAELPRAGHRYSRRLGAGRSDCADARRGGGAMSRPSAFLCPSTGEGVGLGHLHRCLALAEAMPSARVIEGAVSGWIDGLPEGAVVVLDTLH